MKRRTEFPSVKKNRRKILVVLVCLRFFPPPSSPQSNTRAAESTSVNRCTAREHEHEQEKESTRAIEREANTVDEGGCV